jgi:hypothetical protein
LALTSLPVATKVANAGFIIYKVVIAPGSRDDVCNG